MILLLLNAHGSLLSQQSVWPAAERLQFDSQQVQKLSSIQTGFDIQPRSFRDIRGPELETIH
jgi:hypothetical protein